MAGEGLRIGGQVRLLWEEGSWSKNYGAMIFSWLLFCFGRFFSGTQLSIP